MATLSLSLIEIIVLMLGAITLGITIHFFIVSRKSLKTTTLDASGKMSKDLEQWKLKYFNDIEIRDKELSTIRQKLDETEENNNINSIEAEEMRKMNKKLQVEMELLKKSTPEKSNENTAIELVEMQDLNIKLQAEIASLRKSASQQSAHTDSIETEELRRQNKHLQAEIETLRKSVPATAFASAGKKPDYLEQLRQAQSSLMEHNQKINLLLGQIDMVKETEEKQQEIENANKELTTQINDLKYLLEQKEEEINNTRQKEHLTTEMTSRLDSAYNEFNVLQDKIQKLEAQVISSKRLSIDYDDLKETHTKIARDFEDQKHKYQVINAENKQLQAQLNEAEDHLREANFQRQQLQKRVAYLEELNNDMQAVAEANKKLESQLKRVGELESRLNMVAEERDELARKQYKAS
jgi:myosin heavy subunit